MDISKFVEHITVNPDIALDRHPSVAVGAHVQKISEAHTTAKQAAGEAIAANTVLYSSIGALHQNHATLESYRPGRGRPPVAAEQWNEACNRCMTSSGAAYKRGIAAADKAAKSLEQHEKSLDETIAKKLTHPMVTPALGAEIRSYLARMSPQQRKDALLANISSRDYSMVHALQSAPSYLAGFTSDDASFLESTLNYAKQTAAPEEILQLKSVTAMREAISVSRSQLESKYAESNKLAKPLKGKNTFVSAGV